VRRGLPAIWIVAVALGALTGGCAQHRDTAPVPEEQYPLTLSPQPEADSRLLFDPGSDYPLASNLVYRSDWPSTESAFRDPEVIYYRESIYDIQGLWGFNRDLTYRRFRVERVGGMQR